MDISTSGSKAKVESSQDDIPDCEWHTRDPLTGELFYLSKGVLYSKLPLKERQRIISINPKDSIQEEKKDSPNQKHNSLFLTNSAKFSTIYKGTKIQIYGGNSIANCSAQNEGSPQENYAIVTNIIHAGIVILEFICPISLTNLSFGMVSEKDLETNNVSKQFKTFKTSSRRNLIMKINYWNKTCSFYLNDTKISSLNFFEEEKIPIVLIKKKSTCVILNPLVKYLFTTYDTIFTKEILFKLEKKEYLNLDKTGQNNNFVKYQNYFKNSFNKQFDLKYVFGDINDKGEVCNFICARFDDKFTLDLKDNFSKICINKNLSIIDKKDLKQIKINLVNTAHLNYLNDVAYFSKIKSKFTKAEKDEENIENKENKEKDNNIVDNVVKYIIENFENININMKESFAELKEQFKNLKERKNLLEDLKPYSDKGSNGKGNHNSFIDYVKNDDCLLMINTNKIKIIKREENGVFDVTNFLDLKNINNENNKKCIIFDKQDLLFFLQNFDVKEYINYFPSFNKIYCLFSFLKSVKNANTLGKNKILLLQENSEYFYNSIISYLNFSAFITRSHKILAKKMKQSDKEKDKNLN